MLKKREIASFSLSLLSPPSLSRAARARPRETHKLSSSHSQAPATPLPFGRVPILKGRREKKLWLRGRRWAGGRGWE